ncbi:hypothetical protein BDN71DRAFT_1438751 [Pleurotus eryngii]|uniref:RPA43 OB domain-containing protein n=1 Tax=Pleurotus eryngii TaxID=5323 RepID=A0A9P6AB86_PLEER|nr:hypothetical protein BDN71DRAFT_1438751 [Pleurotus eryngii]
MHSTPLKKRKHAQNIGDSVHKKAKSMKFDSDTTTPLVKKDKGKAKEVEESEFRIVRTTLTVSISPIFASNPRIGVEELLDSMVMRYISALEGVVLSHSNLSFIQDTGIIKGDSPYLICDVAFDVVIWSPRVGMTITGKVNLCSPDHISLLVHRTFNVSIPRRHIPINDWEFEYGPAENDPEFGAVPKDSDEKKQDASEEASKDHSGRWIHKLTSEIVGGESGFVSFVVVGLTIANEMLSLVGSLQSDPFSPAHTLVNPSPEEEEEVEAEEDQAENGIPLGATSDGESEAADEDIEQFESDEEETKRVVQKRKRIDGQGKEEVGKRKPKRQKDV